MVSLNKVRKFDSVDAVLQHLQNLDYVVSRPTLFRHRKAGKLVQSEDGTFLESSVIGYANAFLKRNRVSDDSVDVARVSEEKLVSDARRAKALAQLAEVKAKEADGSFIPRGEFERELAKRALWLKSDLQNFVFKIVPEICAIVDGEQNNVAEAIQYTMAELDLNLGRYALDNGGKKNE